MATAKKNINYKSLDDAPAMMTVKQWCELNGVNSAYGYKWANRDDTPTIRFGNKIMIPKRAYKQWLEKELNGE